MNFVFLCGFPYVSNRFGVQEHIYQITQKLAKHTSCSSCHIISMHDECITREVFSNLWIHTVKKELKYYLSPKLIIKEIKKIVSIINPDIIHLHGTTMPYVLAGSILSSEYPVVTTIHGDVLTEAYYKPLLPKLWSFLVSKNLLKRAIRFSDTIIVCSVSMKEKVSLYKPKRIYVVPNGVEKEAFSTHKINKPFSYILYIGALSSVKGIDILINALSVAFSKFDSVPVYIAGSGPELNKMRKLTAQLGLSGIVHFLGFVEGKEKTELIENASLLIVPSRYEAFGIVVLEAMAFGVPVIASRVGGIPEIIGDNEYGLLFDAGNIDQLIENIEKVITDEKIREMYSIAGKKRVKQYQWDNIIIEKTIPIYQEMSLKGN